MRSHKIYWNLTRSTGISQDLPRSHFEITLRLHFGICHVTCETWHLNILHFNVNILAFDTEIVLIFWHFIFDIWHWHFVYMLRFWDFDISILKLWHLTLTLTLYYNTVSISLLDSAVIWNPKKSADSAVIYHGFCGYLSWILWLSGTNIGLRDASTSKNYG